MKHVRPSEQHLSVAEMEDGVIEVRIASREDNMSRLFTPAKAKVFIGDSEEVYDEAREYLVSGEGKEEGEQDAEEQDGVTNE